MIDFSLSRADDVADAARLLAADPAAKFIAGGTNLIDLMKADVERPARLIDITRLPLKTIETTADGGVRIGALVPNADVADHPLIAERYPLLASASSPAPRRSCATWRRPAAICCSARAALFPRHRHALQQARARQRLLRPSTGSTACTRSSAPASTASRRIRPTCAWRWPRWSHGPRRRPAGERAHRV